MTKHDAVHNFFDDKIREITQKSLGFNFSEEYPGSISLVTNYSGKVIKKYIRAGAVKEYGFTIIVVKPYSTDEDTLNLEAMNYAQEISDWLDQQNKKENYPKFPENCQVRKMETLQNMPNLAGINAKENLARYMVQCRIIYFEREVTT